MNNIAQGQTVKVRNRRTSDWQERVFLTKTANGKYICVHDLDVEKYKNGEYFRVGVWNYMQTIPSNLGNFTYGQEVLVSNGGTSFQRRIFVATVGNRVMAVVPADEEKFKSGAMHFKTGLWNTVKKAPTRLTLAQAQARLGGEYEIVS